MLRDKFLRRGPMKPQFLALFLLTTYSLTSFSYDEVIEAPKCSREACIRGDHSEIGFYKTYPRDSTPSLKLNTHSSLLDINFSNSCYTGDTAEVQSIVTSLIGNTNLDFSQGGHAVIIDANLTVGNQGQIKVEITYGSDYEVELIQEVLTLSKCD